MPPRPPPAARRLLLRAVPIVSALGLLALALVIQGSAAAPDERLHHLGNDPRPEWKKESSELPEGRELKLEVLWSGTAPDAALLLTQEEIDNPWELVLNGTQAGVLLTGKSRVERAYCIPGALLREGINELLVRPLGAHDDDILVGRPRLLRGSFREALQLATLAVHVRERGSGKALPARLSFFDSNGQGAPLYRSSASLLALRAGLAYSVDGLFTAELPAGSYTVHALRGTEWSHAQAQVLLERDGHCELNLELERELDTSGWIAADTHIHTFGPSDHGDALLDERLASLAGEGVELAIATDHNHVTDFAPRQAELGLSAHFTSVIGNEVTTENGHFNAFPFELQGRLPDARERDWVKLVADIRAQGAQVVILNHPRWPKPFEDAPFHLHGLDQQSGERASGARYTFDCMELANSTDPKDDALLLFRDWFALQNRGELIRAVGSSDSHTLIDPVGQGRTYLPSATDDPARIDVDAACQAFVAGRGSVSLGIFTELLVDGRARMGDTLVPEGAQLALRLRVAAPSWIRPRKALVFANGEQIAERLLENLPGPLDQWLDFQLQRPINDAWLVCVLLGDDVEGEYWPNANNYTLAATNPVFLDVDGDGWNSARALAEALVKRHADSAEELLAALRRCDEAVALQCYALLRLQDRPLDLARIAREAGHPKARAWLESR